MSERARKCEHDACKCIIDGDENFCSPFCEQRADEGLAECGCGHEDCAISIGLPAAAPAAS